MFSSRLSLIIVCLLHNQLLSVGTKYNFNIPLSGYPQVNNSAATQLLTRHFTITIRNPDMEALPASASAGAGHSVLYVNTPGPETSGVQEGRMAVNRLPVVENMTLSTRRIHTLIPLFDLSLTQLYPARLLRAHSPFPHV